MSVMESSRPNDGLSSLITGIADHMSFSDRPSRIAQFFSDLGPSCTRSSSTFREVLTDMSRTNGIINEAAMASLIFFLSDKTSSAVESGTAGLSSALLGSILVGRSSDAPDGGWNLETVAQVIREDYASLDWVAVAKNWDVPEFKIKDTTQFRALLDLYRAGAKNTPPLTAFTSQWRNTAGQLSVIEAMVAVPPSVFMVPLNEEELADAATAPPPGPSSAPNPQCWASTEILQRLLNLSDAPSLYRRVRDLFVRSLLMCPEILFCSLVRLQLQVASAASNHPGGESLVNAGMQIKTELMRELIPLFFRPNAHNRVQNGSGAIRRLYSISPTTVMAACYEAWRSTAHDAAQVRLAEIMHIIQIAKLLPSPADAVASLLSGNKDPEYSIAIAFVMADNEYLQLKPWLGEKLTSKGTMAAFSVALVSYLRKTYAAAKPRGGSGASNASLSSLENIVISLQLLQSLEPALLSQTVSGPDRNLPGSSLGDIIRLLVEVVLATYPSLRGSLVAAQPQVAGTPPPNPAPPQGASSDDVEEMATAYFQKIYTSEQSIGEVVEMLKRFKTSGIAKENEIFACMVHNLFNEYRFFAKYPEKELRITGILFGALIQEQLVSSITLGIALRYVLEALRKLPSPPGTTTSSGKMFKFGMFALEQFKGRLHEWPQYCSHIVQIPHLKEGYAELVAEIEQEMSKNQNRATGSGSSVSSQSSQGNNQVLQVAVQDRPSSTAGPPSQPPVILSPGTPTVEEKRPEFGPKLGRAVSDSSDEELEFDSPTDTMLDKVQFLVNNLAPSNVEQKAGELKDMMEAKYFGWLGHFLVVKRISTQANFHSLYLSFLDCLGEYGKGLVEAILCSVYHNIGKLLRSSKITTSSSERSFLKNLGIFLGQITLARNRPILQIMLDCKELLLQGYETGKLIAVAPFLAKTLEGARNSIIFRPPNPWLMGILGVFRSVYNVQGLKMNIKFEVEVLCKNLGIKLEDIPLRNDVLARRIPPIKERNPDFNIKAAAPSKPVSAAGTEGQAVPLPVPPPTESVGKGHLITPDQLETVIPNLASYVTVNPSLPQLVQSQGGSSLANLITTSSLKRWVPIAVDRAIREIIQPVVERSVTIACITTKEIVVKDFAMESDETKMRKAGQLMVANLAGSLALVTCREPLRSSISSYLRQLLTGNVARSDKLGEQEQNTIEQCVQICSTDNLELGCRLIEKAATEKAIRDIDDALAPAINARRTHREQTGQPYFDTSIFANGSHRYPAALPDQLRPKPGGLRSEHYQLYESFQRMPRAGSNVAGASAAAGTSVTARGPAPTSTKDDVEGPAPKVLAQQFGTEMLTSIVTKLDALVSSLLAAAGSRAVEIKLAMLPQEHQIRQLLSAIKQVIPSAKPAAGVTRSLTVAEQELVLAFSQGIFKRLYELSLLEPLRLEVLVAVLENVNANCPKLGKDIGTWATYAPTNTEAQRRLHKTILLLLVRSRLLSVHELDVFLAARADQGRNHIWVEFSLLFIRTAFMELIATPSEFPKLIELMTRIVEGRSQASQQFIQAYRKPIVRMLEETRAMSGSIDPGGSMNPPTRASEISIEESSSLTKDYLDKLFRAPAVISDATNSFARNDPASSKQQVTALLDSWVRVQTETFGSDKATNQYIQVLQQFGVGKSEEQTERFLRLATLTFVEATLKSSSHAADSSSTVLNYAFIDVYARLLHVIFRRIVMGGNQTQVDALRLGMLNRILGVVIRTMICHHEKWKVDNPSNPWDQRPWYRLLVNLVVDFNKPDPSIDSIRLGILSVFGVAFHCCQPLILPGKLMHVLFCSKIRIAGSYLSMRLKSQAFRLLGLNSYRIVTCCPICSFSPDRKLGISFTSY